ncbi:MAG: DUF3089 domain-containing protein [Glycocaulis sp.]
MRAETAAKRPGTLMVMIWAAGACVLVLAGIAAWIMRDQVYSAYLDPGVPFQTYTPPEAPDYAQSGSWAVRPFLAVLEEDEPAVFFIHPTVYDGGDHWNTPHDRISHGEALGRLYLPNFAGPFAANAAIFAPRYRSASLYVFLNNREDGLQARRLAYGDVRRAFRQFLSDIGPDRAFIIAGVEQGALHGLGLLIDEIAPDEALTSRLAVAYLTEFPVLGALFSGPLEAIPLCAGPEDVRCVVTFTPVRANERERIDALTERSSTWSGPGEFALTGGQALACVNPLGWMAGEDPVSARQHRGGAAAEGLQLGERPSPLANQTGAQCRNGLLIIEQPRSRTLRRPSRLAEVRRAPPFNLFYADIEADAERRLAIHAAILTEERRWAPDLPDAEEVEVIPVRPID